MRPEFFFFFFFFFFVFVFFLFFFLFSGSRESLPYFFFFFVSKIRIKIKVHLASFFLFFFLFVFFFFFLFFFFFFFFVLFCFFSSDLIFFLSKWNKIAVWVKYLLNYFYKNKQSKYVKSGLSGVGRVGFRSKLLTPQDAQTTHDGRRTLTDHNSSPWAIAHLEQFVLRWAKN